MLLYDSDLVLDADGEMDEGEGMGTGAGEEDAAPIRIPSFSHSVTGSNVRNPIS